MLLTLGVLAREFGTEKTLEFGIQDSEFRMAGRSSGFRPLARATAPFDLDAAPFDSKSKPMLHEYDSMEVTRSCLIGVLNFAGTAGR
jgi:hypothetical protein